MDLQEIIKRLPYDSPFLFVDALEHIDENGARGSYRFLENADFFKGHFKDHPVTPGVILTECCAQIGLVCLGLFLLGDAPKASLTIGMSSSEMEFLLPVYPGEKVWVSSEKIYFRFGKLKCKVKMHNTEGQLVCRGVLAGMLKTEQHA